MIGIKGYQLKVKQSLGAIEAVPFLINDIKIINLATH